MAEAAGRLITGPSQFQFNLPVGRFVAKRRTLEGCRGGERWRTRGITNDGGQVRSGGKEGGGCYWFVIRRVAF